MDHGGHHPPSHEMPDMDMDMDMGMKMYFHLGYDKNVLIYGWDATTPGRMIGTFIAVTLLGIFYEWLKFMRVTLVKVTSDRTSPPPIAEESAWAKWKPHLIQSVLYGLQIATSYTLMLFAMTFNLWIFLGVVVGMTIGYITFQYPNGTHRGLNTNDCCAP